MADGLTDETVSQTLDYLGGSQPGVAPRLSTLPSVSGGGGAVNAPLTGTTTGGPAADQGVSARGFNPQTPGASPFAIAKGAFGVGKSLAELAADVMKPGPLGTRGNVGGEGTNQDASKSLSDTLRSGVGAPAPAGSGAPPEGSALSTPPPEAAGPIIGGEVGSGVPSPGSALSTPPPESLGAPPPSVDPGVAGDLNTGALGGAAVSAALELAATLTGNKDVGTAGQLVGVGAQGAAAASTIAAEVAAEIAGEAAGTTLLGGVGVVTLPIALTSLIASLTGQDWGNLGDMFGAGKAGISKFGSATRKAAAQAWDTSDKSIHAALAASDPASLGQYATSPDKLREIGNTLMAGEQSYYNVNEQDPRGGQAGKGANAVSQGTGPSSYITGSNRPDAMTPFNTGMQRALAINKRLLDQGQPGLQISPDFASAMGISQPVNMSSYSSMGADFQPDWGPAGPPPGQPGDNGITGSPVTSITNWNAPGLQEWLNKKFMAYENAGGMPTPSWDDLVKGGTPSAPDAGPATGTSASDFAKQMSSAMRPGQATETVPSGPEGALGFAQDIQAAA